MSDRLEVSIRKCFKDSYMQTEGNTELFDIEETIQALKQLIESYIDTKINEAREDGAIDGIREFIDDILVPKATKQGSILLHQLKDMSEALEKEALNHRKER